MLNRWKRLLRQAERELERAQAAQAAAKPVWAYYAAHQSAETAVKALRLKHSLNGHERMVARLLLDLPQHVPVPGELLEKAAVIDSHYLPIHLAETDRHQPRTNGVVKCEHAVQMASEILEFVRHHLEPNGNGNGNGKPEPPPPPSEG
jgi:HEPN domain-containing protein